jgi:hypothetical protein
MGKIAEWAIYIGLAGTAASLVWILLGIIKN